MTRSDSQIPKTRKENVVKEKVTIFGIMVLFLPCVVGCVSMNTDGAFTQKTTDPEGNVLEETLDFDQRQRTVWNSEAMMKAGGFDYQFGENEHVRINGSDSEATAGTMDLETMGVLFQFLRFMATGNANIKTGPEPQSRASPNLAPLSRLDLIGVGARPTLEPP